MDDRQPVDEKSDEVEDSPPMDNNDSSQDKPEEADETPATVAIQVVECARRDSSENQQSPSGISAETSSRTSVSISASPSQALNIDQHGEIPSSTDVLYSSHKLNFHTICSRIVAHLSSRQHLVDCEDPVLFGLAESLLKALDGQQTPTPSPVEPSVETGTRPALAKRRRSASSESDSGESETKKESCGSKFSPLEVKKTLNMSPASLQTRNVRDAALESQESLTHRTKKRKFSESGSGDLKTSNDTSFPTSVANIGPKSSTNLPTQSEVTVRSRGESATEDKTKISSRDCSTESNPPEEQYNPDNLRQTNLEESATEEKTNLSEWHQFKSLMNLSREDFEIAMPSNKSLDASSATDTQMSGSSQPRTVSENLDFPSPPIALNSGTGTPGSENSSLSGLFTNPYMPSSSHLPEEQGGSSHFNVPRQQLEFQTHDEEEEVDSNQSDSSARTSNPYVKSKSQSKKTFITKEAEILLRDVSDANLLEDQIPNIMMLENPIEPLLLRRGSIFVSSGASTSRERSDVGRELDPPYLDINQGQPSSSSHQPVVTGSSSASGRFNSSRDNAPSGETRRGAGRTSKNVTNARTLLFTVLEEMMKFNEEKDLYKIFCKLFRIVSKFPTPETKAVLDRQLLWYLTLRARNWNVKNGFPSHEITLEYCIQNAYEDLLYIVVTTLASTLPMWTDDCETANFYRMMSSYTTLRELYKNCSELLCHIEIEDIKDDATKYRVTFLKEIMPRLLLQTRNAFREILMHIGGHATQANIHRYEKHLFEEDKRFFKRQL